MGRWSACADASSAPFDEENTVPAGDGRRNARGTEFIRRVRRRNEICQSISVKRQKVVGRAESCDETWHRYSRMTFDVSGRASPPAKNFANQRLPPLQRCEATGWAGPGRRRSSGDPAGKGNSFLDAY